MCFVSTAPPDSPTDRDFGIIDSILEADLIINRADLEAGAWEREKKKILVATIAEIDC